MSKLLVGIAVAKVEAKKVKNCGKKALSYEAPTYHNSKDRPRPFPVSFVRIKDAGEDLLSHILKLTPLIQPSFPFPRHPRAGSERKRGSNCKKFRTTAEQLRNSRLNSHFLLRPRHKRREEMILRSAIPTQFNATNLIRNVLAERRTIKLDKTLLSPALLR